MPQSFDAVRERLLRAGIAPRHVRRYLTELREHLADLTAKEGAAEHGAEDAVLRARAALGSDEELADAMIARGEFRSFSARAPWVVFGLAPPFLILAAFFLVAFGLIGVLWLFGPHGHYSPRLSYYRHLAAAIELVVPFIANFLIGPLAAMGFVAFSLRQRISSNWPLIGLLLIALFGAVFTLIVRFPIVDGGGGKGGIFIWAGSILHLVLHVPLRRAIPADATLSMSALRMLITLLPAVSLYLALRTRVTPGKN